MSHSTASVLFEDSYGFIWVGTPNGLNKYDGTDFEIFEEGLDGNTGLTHGYIGTIYEDGTDLYIGTNQGLSVYNRSLNQVKPYEFINEGKKIESKNFRSVTKIKGTLWLGTFADGLYSYDIETGELKHFLIHDEIKDGNNNTNHILKVVALDDNRLLVISSSNIFVLTTDLEILTQIQETVQISSVSILDESNFLLGNSNGSLIELNVCPALDLQTKRTSISPGLKISAMEKDKNDAIWVGTENNGLFIYSKATDSIKHIEYSITRPNSLSGNSIGSLLQTRSGVMWMGPYKSGLSFYDPEYFKFKHLNTDPFNSHSLNNKLVNCFSEDIKGNLWIGTDGGGLNYWNRALDTFEHYSLNNANFGSNVVLSLLQTNKEELWAGTWANGITIFNTNSKEYVQWTTENSFLKSNNITDLLQDVKGRIWIINYYGGVQVYNPETNSHKNIPLTSELDGAEINSVYKILEDTKGRIWIGTRSSGLFRLTESGDAWKSVHYHKIHNNRQLSNDFINTIVQDTEGTIWVGTQGGLNKYLPASDSFQSITQQDGLTNDVIKGIIGDKKKHLWLSTEGGIIRYNTITGNTINYDEADGLQSNEFNASSVLIITNGEYIFGGINGMNIFTPDAVEKRQDIPKLFVSGLKLFNKPVLPNDDFGILKKDISQVDSLILNYDHSVINIDFIALTYRHPEKVNYAYFLEGFETEWNYVGNDPNATYTNLNPGDYTLRIKSSNSDGIWVDNEVDLYITITPPFWETWWFRLLVMVLILFCFYIAYYIKVRSIKKDQRRLERKIAERTKELQYQKDKLVAAADELASKNEEIQRFTFAVSHDLKSPLSNIKGIASLIPLEIVLKDFPNIEEYLGLIDVSCNNMNELIADITEIAKLGKIENNNELLNTNEILNLAKDLIRGKLNVEKVELNIATNLPDIYGDRKRMIQVFGNFLDNAIKYMGDQPNPEITIEVEDNGDTNSFLVRDNGLGMDEAALKKLFTPFERFHANVKGTGLGLYMIKQIAAAHGGTITAVSEGKGKGTTFKLILPKAEIAAQLDNTIQEFFEVNPNAKVFHKSFKE